MCAVAAAAMVLTGCVSHPRTDAVQAAEALIAENIENNLNGDPADVKARLLELPTPSPDRRTALARANLTTMLSTIVLDDELIALLDAVEADAVRLDDPDIALAARVLHAERDAARQAWEAAEPYLAAHASDQTLLNCAPDLTVWCGRSEIMAATFSQALTRLDDAAAHFEKASDLLVGEQSNVRQLRESVLVGRGVLAFQQGNASLGASLLTQSADLARQRSPVPNDVILFTNLALVLVSIGNVDEAEVWAKRSEALCLGPLLDQPCDINRAQQALGRVLFGQKRDLEALELIIAIYERTFADGDTDSVEALTARVNVAAALNRFGHYDRALEWTYLENPGSPVEDGVRRTIRTNLALHRAVAMFGSEDTDTEEALRFVEAVIAWPGDIENTRKSDLLAAATRLRLSLDKLTEDDLSRALQDALEAQALTRDDPNTRSARGAGFVLAHALIASGQQTEGYDLLDDVLSRPGTPATNSHFLAEAVALAIRYGDPRRAARYARRGLETFLPESSFALAGAVPPSLDRTRRSLTTVAINDLPNLGLSKADTAKAAFELAQSGFVSQAGRTVRLSLLAESADRPELADLAADLEVATTARAKLLSQPIASEGRAEFLNQIRALDGTIKSTEAEILKLAPHLDILRNQEAVDHKAVASALGEGEVFLKIVSGYGVLNLFLVTPDENLTWRRASYSDQRLCSLVRRLRTQLDPAGRDVCPGITEPDVDVGPWHAVAHELFSATIGEIEDLLDHADTLILAVDGPMASLPFATLLREPIEPSDDLATAPWLIRDFAFVRVPDAASFVQLSAREAAKGDSGDLLAAGAPCLGHEISLGCPEYTGPASPRLRGGTPTVDLSRLPPLPGAAAELRHLASLAGASSQLLIGSSATEQAYRDISWNDINRSVIASHVLSVGELGMREPGIVLSQTENGLDPDNDGFLSASEIATGPRTGLDLLILAGCNSVGPQGGFSTSPLSGLARAFFASGTSLIVMSHIPLRDDVSLEFTEPLIAASGDYHKVLREAMLRAIAEIDADPAVWGGLVVVGR